MTKQNPALDCERQAGAEIDVTEEMARVGERVIWDSGLLEWRDPCAGVASEVFRAMLGAYAASCETPEGQKTV